MKLRRAVLLYREFDGFFLGFGFWAAMADELLRSRRSSRWELLRLHGLSLMLGACFDWGFSGQVTNAHGFLACISGACTVKWELVQFFAGLLRDVLPYTKED